MSYFPIATILLLAANLFVYLWEISVRALTDEASIIRAGALCRANVADGELWRLVSAVFLHGSMDHLLSNGVMLYIVGMACEHALGFGRTLAVYAVSGLAGSLLSLLTSEGPAVGASGAIFGVMACVVVFLYTHQRFFYIRDARIGWVLGMLALYQIVCGFFTPWIDNAAHIGGFAGGALITPFLKSPLLDGRAPGDSHA